MKTIKQKAVWVDKDGKKIKISDMQSDHLINTFLFLEAKREKEFLRWLGWADKYRKILSEEFKLEEIKMDDFAHHAEEKILMEITKRGLRPLLKKIQSRQKERRENGYQNRTR